MEALEKKLNELFVKKAPIQIPKNAREIIVEWSPFINLVIGIFGLLSAWWLWHAARSVNRLITTVSLYTETYIEPVARFGFFFWLAFILLIAVSVLLLASVPGLRDRTINGWKLAYWGALLSFVQGIVYLFAERGDAFSRFVFMTAATVAGLYVLFQIRSYYSKTKPKNR